MHTPAAGLERFTPEPNSVYAPKPPLSATPPPPRSACEPWFKTSAWPVQGDDLESTRKVRQEQGKLFWAGYMYMPEEDERSVAAADIPRYNHAVIKCVSVGWEGGRTLRACTALRFEESHGRF